ncbi:carbohydrate esterase family 9 protein [Lentinula boryana]|uniref:Carbohydrate esterase family 9 protein n=1 Tax=Lentinula boryana TaxID=40481 RepID=A0ABQ8QTT8_9AGAR|nr:carbohydrate esterase family 9 protein [Lentinula boryana]
MTSNTARTTMSSEKALVPHSDFLPPRPMLTFSKRTLSVLWLLLFGFWTYHRVLPPGSWSTLEPSAYVSPNTQEILQKCSTLHARPSQLSLESLSRKRTVSDRYEPGTRNMSYLITNATIFTGAKDDDGNVQITNGDLLMVNGIIRALGEDIPRDLLGEIDPRQLTMIKANGSWVTPGLVDINSQLGIFSSPPLRGSDDSDSMQGPVLPWLRSIDGLHTRDNAFELAIAAGVTSAQILPGASNNIGGQAFVVKLRRTADGSALSMVVDPPQELNSTGGPPTWRHLLQSCSEETRRYGNRMDMMWSLRSAYHEARRVMKAQDALCAQAEAGIWDTGMDVFPDSLQWEMLVDVLRGKVKVTNDCSEAVDLDNMIRLSNEFGFSLAIFLHASEAYLVPTLFNDSRGGTPAVALSSTNHRHARESYRGSEFAPAILAAHNLSIIMTTDQPVINSRQLIDEARKAYHFGLTADLALASITSAPSNALGLGYRMGMLQEGYDADVVMWNSHPLQIGATPSHVWIDGIRQIPLTKDSGRSTYSTGTGPTEVVDSNNLRMEAPGQPSYLKERQDTVNWDGLPPLRGIEEGNRVVFRNVKEVWTRGRNSIDESFVADEEEFGIVIVEKGKITCAGTADDCIVSGDEPTVDVDLHGGSISPGLLTFGSPLGLEDIASEPSTTDGRLFDALIVDVPSIFHDIGGIVRAFDALMFDTRHARIAYYFGVTIATSSLAKPHRLYESDDSMIWGLSTTFRTNAAHALEPEAIIQTETALHFRITRPRFDVRGPAASVSSQLAVLRRLLYGWESRDTDTGLYFRKAAEGVIPLVVEVHNADIMASLIMLRAEVDAKIGGQMRMVFVGATEAWLLAKELSQARVGVILTSLKPVAATWDQRRILPGPPLTNQTALDILLKNGVIVGLGVDHPQMAAETRFHLAQAYQDSIPSATAREVYGLATTNLEQLLGVKGIEPSSADLVAFDGGSVFNLSSKVVAIISPQRSQVDML